MFKSILCTFCVYFVRQATNVYLLFGGTRYFHQSDLWRHPLPPIRYSPPTKLHSVTAQNITNLTFYTCYTDTNSRLFRVF